MSLNGSGVFSVNTSGQPVQSGTLITAAAFNAFTADVATALSTALYKDGQQTATANQPMGGFKHTSVADAVARNQYASAGQAQDGSLTYLTGVSGTNTIAASVSPTPSAYAAGQRFSFIVGTTNTGATTLNVSSLGAKAIKKKMSGGKVALVAADLIANQSAEVFYDGTDFILESARTYSHGADVASASTIDLDSATGDCVDVTGTTSITAVTLTEGEQRVVRFTGALTLTHGSSLVLPGAASITTAAGDFAVFRGYASGVVRCVVYSHANGLTFAIGSGLSVASGTLDTASKPGDWFEANKNGSNQGSFTNGASTKVTFTTEVVDTASEYDAANSKFVPGNGERWQIAATVTTTAGGDAALIGVQLYKNGSLEKFGTTQQQGGTAAVTNQGAWFVQGNGTDYYEIFMSVANASTLTVDGTATKTFIQGMRIK